MRLALLDVTDLQTTVRRVQYRFSMQKSRAAVLSPYHRSIKLAKHTSVCCLRHLKHLKHLLKWSYYMLYTHLQIVPIYNTPNAHYTCNIYVILSLYCIRCNTCIIFLMKVISVYSFYKYPNFMRIILSTLHPNFKI